MKLRSLLIALLLFGTFACDKGGAGGSKSSAVSANELALFSELPAGNTALFGGNYIKFQKHIMNSPFGALMKNLDKSAPGMLEWMNCFTEVPNVEMAGAVRVVGPELDMRFVMKNVTVEQLDACGKRAKYPVVVDADKKFISVETQTALGPNNAAYLVTPSGALYMRQRMELGSMKLPPPTDRAALEADIAELAKGNATKDAALMAEAASVDRSKAMWFVANAAGTPIADKLGLVRGTFDISNGLSFDVVAQVKDSALADKVVKSAEDAKKQAGMLGPDVQKVVEALVVKRDGDRIRAAISISNEQLTKLFEKLGPMMGGALGGG